MNHFYLLGLAAGVLLPLQIAFNNKLTVFSGNPITTSLVSFSVGTLVLLLYNVYNYVNFLKSLYHLGHAPPHAWLGGVIGAFYIITTIVVSPKIGLAIFVALVIAGQLAMSVLLEHFGCLGTEVRPFNWMKFLGLVFVLVGIVLIKKQN